jgi:hypothetical protein
MKNLILFTALLLSTVLTSCGPESNFRSDKTTISINKDAEYHNDTLAFDEKNELLGVNGVIYKLNEFSYILRQPKNTLEAYDDRDEIIISHQLENKSTISSHVYKRRSLYAFNNPQSRYGYHVLIEESFENGIYTNSNFSVYQHGYLLLEAPLVYK